MKKSQARIASAWERRNCDQVGPVRRGAGSMPLALRISQTVDAATLTPRPASSPWILRYPHSGFSRASRRTRALMFRWVAGRPVLPRMDLAAQRRRTMSRCQRRIVSGVTSSRSPWRRALGITLSRAASSARSAQFSFGRRGCLPLQDRELVAQDQDLGGLPRLLTPGQPQPRGDPRDQEEHEPQAHDR